MPSVKIFNVKGENIGSADLSDAHFGVKAKSTLIHQVVVAQQAAKRSASAHTKNRGEVAGGGKKPWKQKGTGRARHGSTRSPIWVGGGITFGPRNERNYVVKINRKVKKQVLFMVLSDRVKHEKLFLVDNLPTETPKTNILAGWMKKLPVSRKVMIVISESNPLLVRMAKNIPNVQVVTVNALHVADMVKYTTIIFEQAAIPAFESLYK
ncbi:MAG: 50S ribosomal protein L4 [Patescibacteria group bacterium]